MPHFCHKCSTEIAIQANLKVDYRAVCDQCSVDLHICLNCTHYDKSAHRECREPQAELVSNKERANYCDYFRFKEGQSVGKAKQGDALKKLDDLFK